MTNLYAVKIQDIKPMLAPETLFALCNAAALTAWGALGLSLVWPRARAPVWRVTGLGLPLVFAVAYAGALAAALAKGGEGGFGSIAAVRALFPDDHALTAGWIHYLAFDLFVGTWIARAGLAAGLHPAWLAPCLALTFLFGPVGLLLFLVLRAALGARPLESLS